MKETDLTVVGNVLDDLRALHAQLSKQFTIGKDCHWFHNEEACPELYALENKIINMLEWNEAKKLRRSSWFESQYRVSNVSDWHADGHMAPLGIQALVAFPNPTEFFIGPKFDSYDSSESKVANYLIDIGKAKAKIFNLGDVVLMKHNHLHRSGQATVNQKLNRLVIRISV